MQYCEEYIVRLHGCAGRSESFPGRICLTKRFPVSALVDIKLKL